MQHRQCESFKSTLQSWELYCLHNINRFALVVNECGWQSSRMGNCWFKHFVNHYVLFRQLRFSRFLSSLLADCYKFGRMREHMHSSICSGRTCMQRKHSSSRDIDLRI